MIFKSALCQGLSDFYGMLLMITKEMEALLTATKKRLVADGDETALGRS